ncbi:unnamed protein product [Rhodiola kirilowii]
MGNGIGKISVCFTGEPRRSHSMPAYVTEPLDEGLGHSFCYVRPDPIRLSSSKVHSEEATATTTFRSISGASVSANASTPLSTSFGDLYSYSSVDRSAAAFESSTSFASIPLQPIPRNLMNSGPMIVPSSGPLERGFMSGPIERGFMSGPIEPGMFSGPMEKTVEKAHQFQRSFSYGGFGLKSRIKKGSLIRVLQRAISKKMVSRGQKSMIAPISKVKESDWVVGSDKAGEAAANMSSDGSLYDDEPIEGQQNLQWAQGKAGEDRVHVVVSEEHGWVFVGIYDGFNGPDAPDYLLSNLYSAVHKELKGLLWGENNSEPAPAPAPTPAEMEDEMLESCSRCVEQDAYPKETHFEANSRRRHGRNLKNKHRGVAKKWEENQQWWRCEWDLERLELDWKLKQQLNKSNSSNSESINHSQVLKALSEALRKTEEAYLEVADKMLVENPELALMGSCVLVMLMKGEDVYVMNVGDSRAVLGQKADAEDWLGTISQDLERINEETLYDLEGSNGDRSSRASCLNACQLTIDHSTNIEEEVIRIRNEHPDDACAVMNERLKGSLKVTRAFGAGFLKQPKWNNALLEMFRIDYIGNAPYLTCQPSLYHHKLGSKDRFLILSSDGLYQYFTNEEAVSEVELFIVLQPDGDPAQHLVEEVLFRAAKRAGMDFHELLEIPQGDRRRYHDDVSIIVISLEGRIWRSCV